MLVEQKSNLETRDERYEIPVADIRETSEGIAIQADMPGADKESVDITVERSTLTITGKTKIETPEGYELAYSEYDTTGFKRSFTLSDEYDLNKVVANFKDGILTVSIPKSESAKPKKIKVH